MHSLLINKDTDEHIPFYQIPTLSLHPTYTVYMLIYSQHFWIPEVTDIDNHTVLLS